MESHSPVLCCCYTLLSISSPAFSPFLSYFLSIPFLFSRPLCAMALRMDYSSRSLYVILKAKVEIML